LGSIHKIQVENLAAAYQEGSPIDRNFLLFLIACCIIVLARRRLNWSAIFQRNILVVLFFIYCLISIFWADFPFIAFKRLIKFVGLLAMVLIVLSEHSPTEAILVVMRRSSYVLMLLSLLFIKYFPLIGRYYNEHNWEVAYGGVSNNKNILGTMCIISALVFSLDLISIIKNKKDWYKTIDAWTGIVLLFVTFYILNLANSSTSFMCTIIGIALIIIMKLPVFKNNPRTAIYYVIGIGAILALCQLTFDLKGVIIHALGRRPDLTDRTFIWDLLLGMKTNPIIGTGYESFWTLNRMNYVTNAYADINEAHNGYIETYLNLGIIGVIFFISFFVTVYKKVYKEIIVEREINILKLAFIILFIFYNYTEAAFPRVNSLAFYLFAFAMIVPLMQNLPAVMLELNSSNNEINSEP
jgi:O-antigen ligase